MLRKQVISRNELHIVEYDKFRLNVLRTEGSENSQQRGHRARPDKTSGRAATGVKLQVDTSRPAETSPRAQMDSRALIGTEISGQAHLYVCRHNDEQIPCV